jgi:tRNA1(Val) A37 N6-methylase TrmN6
MEKACGKHGLWLCARWMIHPVEGQPAHRTMLQFSRKPCTSPAENTLAIREPGGNYTSAYLDLTAAFHQWQ